MNLLNKRSCLVGVTIAAHICDLLISSLFICYSLQIQQICEYIYNRFASTADTSGLLCFLTYRSPDHVNVFLNPSAHTVFSVRLLCSIRSSGNKILSQKPNRLNNSANNFSVLEEFNNIEFKCWSWKYKNWSEETETVS